MMFDRVQNMPESSSNKIRKMPVVTLVLLLLTLNSVPTWHLLVQTQE